LTSRLIIVIFLFCNSSSAIAGTAARHFFARFGCDHSQLAQRLNYGNCILERRVIFNVQVVARALHETVSLANMGSMLRIALLHRRLTEPPTRLIAYSRTWQHTNSQRRNRGRRIVHKNKTSSHRNELREEAVAQPCVSDS